MEVESRLSNKNNDHVLHPPCPCLSVSLSDEILPTEYRTSARGKLHYIRCQRYGQNPTREIARGEQTEVRLPLASNGALLIRGQLARNGVNPTKLGNMVGLIYTHNIRSESSVDWTRRETKCSGSPSAIPNFSRLGHREGATVESSSFLCSFTSWSRLKVCAGLSKATRKPGTEC